MLNSLSVNLGQMKWITSATQLLALKLQTSKIKVVQEWPTLQI